MSDRFLPHIAAEIIGRPLLILPEKLGIIAEVLAAASASMLRRSSSGRK